MLTLPRGIRIFAYALPTDLRRSFDRLTAMVREHLRHDPLGGNLYLFRNRSGNRVRAKVVKNKISTPFAAADLELRFGRGFTAGRAVSAEPARTETRPPSKLPKPRAAG